MRPPRKFVLANRPRGTARPEDFALAPDPQRALSEGEIRVENRWLGLSPSAWLRMNQPPGGGYDTAISPGDVIHGQSLGTVVESRSAELPAGTVVALTAGGWREVSVADAGSADRVDQRLAPDRVWLGPLGVSGLTAYAGLFGVAGLEGTETVVVSAASGAVGSLVGQMARISGCRVVGIAGGPGKCALLTSDLGFDAAVDYRSESFAADLQATCYGTADLYFDNVGGTVRDTVLPLMRPHGRVVVCGMIAEYGGAAAPSGQSWAPILSKRLTVSGFLMRDHRHMRDAFVERMAGWIANGDVIFREDVTDGFENTPNAFVRMLAGRTTGKTLVRL